MRLFEKIKENLTKKKVDNDLDNLLYGLLDSAVATQEQVNKGLMSKSEAAGFLNAVCEDTHKKVEQLKIQDEEVFIKYSTRFEKRFNEINSYINSISPTLQV